MVDGVLLSQAHLVVLHNTEEVKPYIDQHMSELKQQYGKKARNEVWLQNEHNKTFRRWLNKKVEKELENEDEIMAEEKKISKYLRWISQGPRHIVVKYNGYDINGCRYRTKSHDVGVNQNCGVSLEASGMHIASAKDSNPKIATSRYYGVINEIWVLDYHCVKIPVFLCDWVHSGYGVKTDELGYTLVDLNRLGHKKDPFILPSQANQVFYVEDQGDPRWSVVISCPLNDYMDDDDVDEIVEDKLMSENRRPEDNMAVDMSSLYVDDDSDTSYFRDDGKGIYVDPCFEQ